MPKFLNPITITTPSASAPLVVNSSTLVSNFNADLLDGQHGSYYQNASNLNAGTIPAAQMPAHTGDVTSTAGSVNLSLPNVGTAGTYRSVTTDAKGRVTAGTNPTTLAGYGITDALPLSGGTLTGGLTGTSANFNGTFIQTGEALAVDACAIVHNGNVECYYQLSRRLQAFSHLGSTTTLEIEAVTLGNGGYGGEAQRTTWRISSRGALYVTRHDEHGGAGKVFLKILNDTAVPDANGQDAKYVVGLVCGNTTDYVMVWMRARFLQDSGTSRWVTIARLATAAPSTVSGSAMTYSSGWIANTGFTNTSFTEVVPAGKFSALALTGVLTSTVATGTAPLVIASTTAVANLNSDLLDDQHGAYYRDAGNLNAGTLQAARLPAFTGGDVTSTAGTVALTLANSGVTAGTYTKVTVDAKGRVTTGALLASADLPTYTGTITSGQVTTALGFTPYNATNPSGYITSTASITGYSGGISVSDSRAVVTTPQSINMGVVFDFKQNTTDGLSDGGTYFGEMTFRQYGSGTDWSGGSSHQLGFTDNGNIWQRSGSNTTWGAWKKLLDTSNFSSHALPLSGGTLTGQLFSNSKIETTGVVTGSSFSGAGTGLTGTAASLTAGAVPWTGVTGKPTTLAGYGITDALPITGGALTGTISIDTSGSTALVSSVVIKRSGQSSVNFGQYPGAWRSALQIQSNASDRLLFLAPPEADHQFGMLRSANGGLKIDVGGTTANQGTNAVTIDTAGTANFPVGLQQNGSAVLTAATTSAPNLSVGGSAGSVAWTGVTGKPTTLSGYGITDALPLAGGTLSGLLTAGAGITMTGGRLYVSSAASGQTYSGTIHIRDSEATGANNSFAGIAFSSAPGADFVIGKYSNAGVGRLQIRNHQATVLATIEADGSASFAGGLTATNFTGPGTGLTGTAAGLSIGGSAVQLNGQAASFYQNAGNLNAGTLLAARMPAFTGGDVTSTAGTVALTLANSGVTAGTYRSVTTDAKGRVTAGTNPTTLAGYGITDALDTSGTAQTKSGNLTVNSALTSGGAFYAATTVQYSNRQPIYTIYYGGGQDLAWKKVADINIGTGFYRGVTFKVDVVDNQGNFGWNSNCLTLTYFASCIRSAGVQDDFNNAVVTGPVADYVRVVKTATGVYELQIRQLADWQTYVFTVEATINSGGNTVTYASSTPPNGSTTGTIYTATPGWTSKLANIDVAGGGSFGGAVSFAGQITSTVATGTAPFVINSTTQVNNLNAQLLGGQLSTYYAAASSLTNYLPKSGGAMTGALALHSTGTNGFYNGTGDAATYALYNFKLGGWNGMALENLAPGGTYPSQVVGVIDFRGGTIDMKGGFKVNGASVITENQSITISGDASGTGKTAINLTLASVGTAGTYRSVTTDAKGRVTAGTNPTTLAGYGITDALPLTGGTLTGQLNANSGLSISGSLFQGDYTRRQIALSGPGTANFGNWKQFIRLWAATGSGSNLFTLKVSVRGQWNWSAVFGTVEAYYSLYLPADSTISSLRDFRITHVSGPATDNIRLGDAVIENGFVSIPVWCANTNGLEATVEQWTGAKILGTVTTAVSEALPAFIAPSFRGGLTSNGPLIITDSNSGVFLPSTNDARFNIQSGTAGAWLDIRSETLGYAAVNLYGSTVATGRWSAGMTGGNSNYRITSGAQGAGTVFMEMNSSTNATNFPNALQQNGNQVVHSGNVASYALPIGGGTVTGQVLIGSYMSLNSSASIMGMVGFNRNAATGAIFNASYGAYQLHNNTGTLELQVYNSAGGFVGAHTFNNSGNVAFLTGAVTAGGNQVVHAGNVSTYALPIGGGTLNGNLTMGSGYQHRASDGSASAPGYSFSAETSTGIYRSGTNTLAFSTGGSQRVTINGVGAMNVTGAITQAGNQVLHAGNYNSYAVDNTKRVKQFFWDSLGASTTQARRFEIARIAIDIVNWNQVGTFEIELHEQYYSKGIKKRYAVRYGYSGTRPGLTLVEMTGAGDNNFQVVLGSEQLVSGNHYYLPIYVDVRYYSFVDVRVTTSRQITTNSTPPVGYTYINSSPTPTNITDFTADSTVDISNAATAWQAGGNVILHAGNYNSYALPLTGGTLTGGLSGTTGSFSGEVTWSGWNSGNARAVRIGYSGGNYGGIGYGINYTSTSGSHTYAFADAVTRIDLADGIQVYSAAAGTAGAAVSWTTLLEATRGNGNLRWKGNTVLDSNNYNSFALPLSGGTMTGNIILPATGYVGLNGGSTYGIGTLATNRNSGVFDTVESTGTDPLELNYYQGGAVKIGSGTYGSKSLYAAGIFDGGNQVVHAGNVSSYALPIGGGTLTGQLTIATGGATGLRVNSPSGTQGFWLRVGYDTDGTATPVASALNTMLQSSGSSAGTFTIVCGNDRVATLSTAAANFAVALQQGGNQVLHAGNYNGYAMLTSGIPSGSDQYVNFRVIRNSAASPADGMYIGYGNTSGGRTRIYGEGSTSGHFYPDSSGNLFRSDGVAYIHSSNVGNYIVPQTNYTTAINATGYTWIRIPYANGSAFNSGQSPVEFYVTRSIFDNSSTPYGGPTAKFVIQSMEWHSGQQMGTIQYGERGDSASLGAANWITHAKVTNMSGGGYWVYMRLRTGTAAGVTYMFRRSLVGGQGLDLAAIEATTDPGGAATIYYGFNLISAGTEARFYRDGNQVIDAGGFSGSLAVGYGSFTSPGITIGDAQYGLYASAGSLFYKSASTGIHNWRNIANNANTMSLDNNGNLTTIGAIASNVARISSAYTANNSWINAYFGGNIYWDGTAWQNYAWSGNNGWATMATTGTNGSVYWLSDAGTGNFNRTYTEAQFLAKIRMTLDGSGNFNAVGAITQNGNQVLHAGNYNSYALPLTGGTLTGALNSNSKIETTGNVIAGNFSGPGTGITGTATSLNIGGNAATATSSPLLSALSNYVWSAATLPQGYNQGIQASFVSGSQGFQNYGSVVTVNTYSAGGGALQLYVPYSPTYGGTGMQVRFGNYDVSSGNSWTSWKTLLASDNYTSYTLPLTGGTLTGALTATSFSGAGTGLTGTASSLTAGAVAWTGVTGKPTTISGYGITDALDTSATAQTKAGNLTISGVTTTKSAGTTTGTPLLRFAQTIGDAYATSFTITHNLGTQDVHVQIRRISDGSIGNFASSILASTANSVTVTFASAPTSSQYRVIIFG